MNKYFSEAFNIPIDKVLSIGTPTVDYLKKKNSKIEKQIYLKYPIMKKKINVLYSPTFRNDNTNNLDEIIKNFDFDKCNLIITFHPKVTNKLNDNRVIYINRNEFSTFDILKNCDYVITDYSALMIDAVIANKKILLYVYDIDKYSKNNGLNINLLKEFSNITSKDAKKLVEIIINNKYDNNEFKKFKKMYTPNIKNSSTKEIVKLIKRCLYNE
jgi:CDP-glycerol glycerophosphotransferase (TagB/SpsB family)